MLKFLGLPLKQIAQLVKRDVSLADTLRRQRHVLVDKRRQLQAAIHAIERAERSVQSCEPDWALFKAIVREIEMQNNTDWSRQYYSPDAQTKVEARKELWSPELQERVTKEWAALVADIEATITADPASPKAQALAARWQKLIEGFTGGDPEIQKGLNKMWADKANWPEQERERFHITPEVQEFIVNAINATAR